MEFFTFVIIKYCNHSPDELAKSVPPVDSRASARATTTAIEGRVEIYACMRGRGIIIHRGRDKSARAKKVYYLYVNFKF